METSIRNRVDNNQNQSDWYQNLTPKETSNINPINSMNNSSTSYHNNTLDESNNHISYKDKIITDNEYKNDLLIAIIPLVLILLVFGGKLSILVLCFGCLFCYIFDLMGSIEGTLISLVITMLSQIACIVWTSRVFLSESIWNFSLILLIWIIIFYSFIISCNFFHGIVNEFAMILSILNVLMFATIPMIGSAFISWFLCVEIPSLELTRCFTIIYFIYMCYLGHPRVITKVIMKNNTTNSDMMVIDRQELTVLLYNDLLRNSMYIQPVIISLLISIALHWNVLSTMRMFSTNILLSICEPALLMILCYQWHTDKLYKITNKNKEVTSTNILATNNDVGFEIMRLVIAIICIFQVQNHPMFDDLKAYSSLSEVYVGYAIMTIFGLIVIAYYLRNFLLINKIKLDEVDEFYLNTLSKQQKQRNACIYIMEACVTLCFGIAIAIFGYIINLSNQVIPVTVIGAIAFSEYYNSTSKSVISNILMLLLSACSTWVTALNFSQNTIYYLVYELIWHFNITMSQFSLLFSILVACAITLPSILTISEHTKHSINKSKHSEDNVLLGETNSNYTDNYSTSTNSSTSTAYSSTSNNSASSSIFLGSHSIRKTMSAIGNYVFECTFPIMVIIFSTLELMFREQDWSSIQIHSEMIYPSYYFTATAIIIIATTIVLYYHNTIGITSTWIVLTVELSKLLKLVNISSLGIFSFCLLIQAYTLPFIRQIYQYIRIEKDGINTIDASSSLQGYQRIQIHSFEIILYVIIATIATYWAKVHMIIHNLLVYLLSRDPSELQQISLALGIWFLYITSILQVFCFQWKFIRSFTFVVSVMLLLLALDSFGHLKLISIDSSLLRYSITSEEEEVGGEGIAISEHPVIFLILSMIVPILAWIQVIPLYNLMNCMIYSLLFAFISTKTTITWAFPLTLAIDSINHNLLSFPFIYLYLSKFFLILTAVWNPSINAHQRRNNYMIPTSTTILGINSENQGINIITKVSFIVFCCIPFFAIIYTVVYDLAVTVIFQGILWSAMVGCTTLCITTRYIELFQNANGNIHYTSISQQFICIPTSFLVIFWMIMAVFMNHKLDYVTLIPLSTLLLLSIKPGSLYNNTTSSEIISKIWAIFWISISIYSILIKGLDIMNINNNNYNSIQNEFDHIQHTGLFGFDSDISIWSTNNNIYISISNLIQVLLLIPALYKGFYPNKNDKEEMLFIIAIFSLLPILGSQINSIRLVGILSMIWNGWRFYEIGRKTQYSNQLI